MVRILLLDRRLDAALDEARACFFSACRQSTQYAFSCLYCRRPAPFQLPISVSVCLVLTRDDRASRSGGLFRMSCPACSPFPSFCPTYARVDMHVIRCLRTPHGANECLDAPRRAASRQTTAAGRSQLDGVRGLVRNLPWLRLGWQELDSTCRFPSPSVQPSCTSFAPVPCPVHVGQDASCVQSSVPGLALGAGEIHHPIPSSSFRKCPRRHLSLLTEPV